MRALIQRVSEASVTVEGKVAGKIGVGLLILVGVEGADKEEDAQWLANKISGLRIFPDDQGLMNKSLIDCDGEALVVSQFTLHASTKKGTRPSFIKAAKPDQAVPMYERFCDLMKEALAKPIQTGIFGAHMNVSLVNDGPVTIMIDTKNKE